MKLLHCDRHSERDAVGRCRVCGKPVCGECAVTVDGCVLCDDRFHQTVLNEYKELLTTGTTFEMEIIVKNLESNGVKVKWFDLHQYGCSPGANVFVLNNGLENALTILKQLDLLDFTSRHSYGE